MNEPQKKALTKTEVIAALATGTGLTKPQVSALLDEMVKLISESLAPDGPGVFNLPGLMKIRVTRKPAEPERKGLNPFTKEPTVFKAKPARSVVKISALKRLKDSV